MMAKWTIGLDFGTNSVRALLVNIETGEEAASAVWNYPSGEQGVILDSKDAFLARQNPLDYLKGLRFLVPSLLRKAARLKGFAAGDVIGIGDAENDLDFLASCGYSAAVANAVPRVKMAVDLILEAPNGSGILELINRLMASD
ncbi:MAG: Ribulokinase [candidate division BRC1 bacterium ADurb.Bin183]|nr:MAG: Ribulokinase [candidate division BRC1 bacterium ADurb.Bin183]